MMTRDEADARVLAALRDHGPGKVSVKLLAAETGVPRVAVSASIMALTVAGLVCALHDLGETQYVVQHLHAMAGRCEDHIGAVVVEVHPDSQG
jgi:DNA-binding transcriptional ArsR family regulator